MENPGAHPSPPPLRVLLGVWAVLMALTGFTVYTAGLSLGRFDVAVALTIATVKAALVALVFMDLRRERGLPALFLAGSVLFVLILVSLALLDRAEYQPDIEARSQAISGG